jgi:lipopolysaccharide transport system permease protein
MSVVDDVESSLAPSTDARLESSHAAVDSADPRHVETIIEPSRGWQLVDVSELWRYRGLLGILVWRDVKVRYKQTVLGAAWAILQPVMMMVVFTVFFARLANVPAGGLPYPLFVFAGLLPWTFFSTAILSGANSVVGAERLITKIYFPRLAIPLSALGAALVDFAIALLMLFALMAWYRQPPSMNLWLAPVLIGCFMAAAAGVGTMLAALNVAYRDFRYVVPFMVQLWMFATPSIYMDPAAAAPSTTGRWLMIVNPLTPLVAGFRTSIFGGAFDWPALATAAVVSLGLFCAGCLYFRRVEDSFSDII